jgi:hypothetical protein
MTAGRMLQCAPKREALEQKLAERGIGIQRHRSGWDGHRHGRQLHATRAARAVLQRSL